MAGLQSGIFLLYIKFFAYVIFANNLQNSFRKHLLAALEIIAMDGNYNFSERTTHFLTSSYVYMCVRMRESEDHTLSPIWNFLGLEFEVLAQIYG